MTSYELRARCLQLSWHYSQEWYDLPKHSKIEHDIWESKIKAKYGDFDDDDDGNVYCLFIIQLDYL